jgi:hypothetical protein
MFDNEHHGESRESDSDARAIEISRCRRGSEDLSDDDARAVADAEDDTESCGTLEVAGEIAVEPDDAEAGLWNLGQWDC